MEHLITRGTGFIKFILSSIITQNKFLLYVRSFVFKKVEYKHRKLKDDNNKS